MLVARCSVLLFFEVYSPNRFGFALASFPGPAQLSVISSTVLEVPESWEGLGMRLVLH